MTGAMGFVGATLSGRWFVVMSKSGRWSGALAILPHKVAGGPGSGDSQPSGSDRALGCETAAAGAHRAGLHCSKDALSCWRAPQP